MKKFIFVLAVVLQLVWVAPAAATDHWCPSCGGHVGYHPDLSYDCEGRCPYVRNFRHRCRQAQVTSIPYMTPPPMPVAYQTRFGGIAASVAYPPTPIVAPVPVASVSETVVREEAGSSVPDGESRTFKGKIAHFVTSFYRGGVKIQKYKQWNEEEEKWHYICVRNEERIAAFRSAATRRVVPQIVWHPVPCWDERGESKGGQAIMTHYADRSCDNPANSGYGLDGRHYACPYLGYFVRVNCPARFISAETQVAKNIYHRERKANQRAGMGVLGFALGNALRQPTRVNVSQAQAQAQLQFQQMQSGAPAPQPVPSAPPIGGPAEPVPSAPGTGGPANPFPPFPPGTGSGNGNANSSFQ